MSGGRVDVAAGFEGPFLLAGVGVDGVNVAIVGADDGDVVGDGGRRLHQRLAFDFVVVQSVFFPSELTATTWPRSVPMIRRSFRQAGEPGARAGNSAAKISLPVLMSMARSWASQPETKVFPSAMAGAELTRSPDLPIQTCEPSAALRQ